MASIGVRFDNSSAGTDLASVLSKALTGGADDAVKYARAASDIETDAYRQRLLREQATLNTQQAIAKWQENQILHAQHLANMGAVDPATQLGVDAMGNPIAPAETPAVVPDAVLYGGGGMPEHLVPTYDTTTPAATPPTLEQDWTYRVNQYPLQSTEPPALIDPTITGSTAENTMPYAGPLTDMVGRAASVDTGVAGQPVVGTGQPVVGIDPTQYSFGAMLDRLLGAGTAPTVGPEETHLPIEPVPQPPLTGATEPPLPVGAAVTPLPGATEAAGAVPPAMRHVLPLQSQTAMPLPIDAEALPPAPVEVLQPSSRPSVPPALPPEATLQSQVGAVEPPLPVGETVPPITDAQRVLPVEPERIQPTPPAAEVITVPGRGRPVMQADAGTPPAAGGTEPGTTPPPAGSVSPVTPTTSSTLAVKGSDGGKSDTATTVQTKAGPMPREGVEALMKAIWIGAGSPAEKTAAMQRVMGTLGTTYNPEYGQDAVTTENLASLRGGGAAIGKESQAATLTAAPADPYLFQGTGMDPQDQNIVTQVREAIRLNQPIDPKLAGLYDDVIARNIRPETYSKKVWDPETETEKDVLVTKPGPKPLWFVEPALVYERAGMQVPGAGAAAAPAQPAQPAAAAATTDTTAAATTDTTAAPATTATGSNPYAVASEGTSIEEIIKGGGKRQSMTQDQRQTFDYLMGAKPAADAMKSWTAAELPTWGWNAVYESGTTTNTGAGFFEKMFGKGAKQLSKEADPKIAAYQTEVNAFIEPLLRSRSGAATTPADREMLIETFIPVPGDDQVQIDLKAQKRQYALEGLAYGVYGKEPTGAVIRAYVENRIAGKDVLPAMQEGGQVPAAAGAGGDWKKQPDGTWKKG